MLSGVAKAAFKLRAEIVERGGMRRTWLRGRDNVHKRYLLHVAGHNLGLLMRALIGAGTPKEASARGSVALMVASRGNQSLITILMLIDAPDAALAAAIVIPLHPSRSSTSSTVC